jgi:hypothetical protein
VLSIDHGIGKTWQTEQSLEFFTSDFFQKTHAALCFAAIGECRTWFWPKHLFVSSFQAVWYGEPVFVNS